MSNKILLLRCKLCSAELTFSLKTLEDHLRYHQVSIHDYKASYLTGNYISPSKMKQSRQPADQEDPLQLAAELTIQEIQPKSSSKFVSKGKQKKAKCRPMPLKRKKRRKVSVDPPGDDDFSAESAGDVQVKVEALEAAFETEAIDGGETQRDQVSDDPSDDPPAKNSSKKKKKKSQKAGKYPFFRKFSDLYTSSISTLKTAEERPVETSESCPPKVENGESPRENSLDHAPESEEGPSDEDSETGKTSDKEASAEEKFLGRKLSLVRVDMIKLEDPVQEEVSPSCKLEVISDEEEDESSREEEACGRKEVSGGEGEEEERGLRALRNLCLVRCKLCREEMYHHELRNHYDRLVGT